MKDSTTTRNTTRSTRSGNWWSILLVILGLVLLIGDFSLINFSALIRLLSRFWPTALIAFGIGTLVRGKRRNFHRALLYIVGGALLQVFFLGWMSFDMATVWPVAFLLFGAYMLATARASREEERVDTEHLALRTVLDGRTVEVEAKSFRGGKCSCTVASLSLDLSHARAGASDMELRLSAFAGGIVLRVPEDWRVTTTLSTHMTAVYDRRHVDPIEFGEDSPTLLVSGRLTLSRLEIQD